MKTLKVSRKRLIRSAFYKVQSECDGDKGLEEGWSQGQRWGQRAVMKTENSGIARDNDRCDREIHKLLTYGFGNQEFGGTIH